MIIPNIRKHVEALYTDKATILENKKVNDPVTHETKSSWVIVYEDEPCRISYLSAKTDEGEYYDSSEMKAELFIRPDIEIKEGSRITVEREGRLQYYECSGISKIYKSHQEINIRLYKDN